MYTVHLMYKWEIIYIHLPGEMEGGGLGTDIQTILMKKKYVRYTHTFTRTRARFNGYCTFFFCHVMMRKENGVLAGFAAIHFYNVCKEIFWIFFFSCGKHNQKTKAEQL